MGQISLHCLFHEASKVYKVFIPTKFARRKLFVQVLNSRTNVYGKLLCFFFIKPFSVIGPCRATKKAYGFNRDTGRCEGFVYGGKAKKIPETSIVDPE